MTQIDYEKKYNEALERAKAYHRNELAGSRKEMIEYIFPELSETEDERIRKFLIDILSSGVWRTEWPFSPVDCVSYLEKQKEQKPSWKPTQNQAGNLDRIDQWLLYNFGLLPGSCSSITSSQYSIARKIAEALWPHGYDVTKEEI